MFCRFSLLSPTRLLRFGLALALTGGFSAANAQQPVEMDIKPPELIGGPWLNTVKNAPVKLAARKGKVTILEFWTFG